MENLNKFKNLQNLGEIDIVNSKKKGSFLEWVIKRIFQTVGFYATNKKEINNNQIDVFVNYNDIKIVVECKQYEKNTPAVKNLIYEWNSKRTEMECDKTLLVLWGYPKIEQDESKLAKKLNVNLWNDTIIFNFFNLILHDIVKAKNEILLNLEINNDEVKEIINSLKEEIEKKFEDFSIENENLVELLKDEIFDCYKKGVLIKQKKFEIIWEFLNDKKCHIMPHDIYGDLSSEEDYTVIKSKHDFDIQQFEDDGKIYSPGVIGVSLYSRGMLAKDGRTIIGRKPIFE